MPYDATEFPEMLSAHNPTIRLLWLIMSIIIKNRHEKVSFVQRRASKNAHIIIDDKFEMEAPPYRLFSYFVKTLRHIILTARKNYRQSPFSFTFNETSETKELYLFINYSTQTDPLVELEMLLHNALSELEAQKQQKNLCRRATKVKNIIKIFGAIILTAVATYSIMLFYKS